MKRERDKQTDRQRHTDRHRERGLKRERREGGRNQDKDERGPC